MNRLLGIDTSFGGVALAAADANSGEVLDSYICVQPRAAERELASQAKALLSRIGKPNKVVVAVGPGSFTGIRIGIAFARGLVAGLDGVRLGGLSSLQALAGTLAGERGLVVFLRIAAKYGVMALAQAGGVAVLRGVELESCLRACIENEEERVIAGRWSELEARLQQHSLSYRNINAEQVLATAMEAMLQVACQTGVREVQPLYLRQPYVNA